VRAAYAVNMRAVLASYVGNYEQAAALAEQAVAMARANQDVREQARSLGNLAWANNRRGFIAQAAAEYEALLPMIEKEKQPFQYAVTLGNFGFCLIALGDFDRALALHNEALAMYSAQGRETERAIELAALGGLYLRIGDAARALEILRMAIAAQEKVGDGIGQASSLRVAGNAASMLGQHDEALGFLRKSAQIDANKNSAARTRVLIAGELRALGDLRGAQSELDQALESGNALVHANALEERARLRSAQHDPTAAIADLRAADREYVALGLEFNRIDTNTALSRALLAGAGRAGCDGRRRRGRVTHRAHSRQVGEPGMAGTFPVGAVTRLTKRASPRNSRPAAMTPRGTHSGPRSWYARARWPTSWRSDRSARRPKRTRTPTDCGPS
jgi:tetratricopeptide (TPR) repeat protein